MILSLALIFSLGFFGFLITYFFRLKLFLEERVSIGLLLGTIGLGYLMLVFSNFIDLNWTSLTLTLFFINITSLINFHKKSQDAVKEEFQDFRKRIRERSWQFFLGSLLFFILLFGFLTSQLLTENSGRLFVQPVHAYGDISLHLGIISSFAYGNNFPLENPILAGTSVSYPFLFDFITAIFVNPLSLELNQAVALTGMLMTTIIIVLLGFFTLRITESKLAGVLSLALFFFNGGLGFIYFFSDHQNLLALTEDFTALKELGFWWINVVISMLLPQRSFLLGLPVAILILALLLELINKFEIRKLVLAILLTSLLPLIHAHTLVALIPFLGLGILRIIRKNNFLQIALVCTVGALVTLILSKLFLQQVNSPFELIHVQLGWMSKTENILVFYIKNFGVSLLLVPAFIVLGIKNKLKAAYIALIGLIWFILPSIYRFQPWEFDNIKLFIYWYLTSIPLIAYYFSKLILSKKNLAFGLAILLLIAATFSGGLDVFRLLSSSGTKHEVYSTQAKEVGEFIKNNTDTNAIFLAVDKFDNPAVVLAGRKVLLGFHGWLWTYGINYSSREIDVSKMLAGQTDLQTFKNYGITHVIFFSDPTDYLINKQYFYNNFKLIYNQDGYEIFTL